MQSVTFQTFPGPTSELKDTGLVPFQVVVTDNYQLNI